MLDPYTMEKLNAERLKDLDREAAGLHFSRLARRNRHAAVKRPACDWPTFYKWVQNFRSRSKARRSLMKERSIFSDM
ncbi:MAG: hypothetical protein QNJ04_06095 [Desulfobacterales bacterium]|nr:hypothetical protein [Desulfobacterales bacterium]